MYAVLRVRDRPAALSRARGLLARPAEARVRAVGRANRSLRFSKLLKTWEKIGFVLQNPPQSQPKIVILEKFY